MGVIEKDLIFKGRKFGLLTATQLSSRDSRGRAFWLCQCDCGSEPKEHAAYSLKRGDVESCGCLQKKRTSEANTTHGQTPVSGHSPEYRTWHMILNRCLNPKADNYNYYGGRGISVCERWLSFENFFADMGTRPSLKHSIDRKNTNGNYEPNNCRWATPKEQANNRRKRKPKITLDKDPPIK
jgi:hypothetical protein